VLDDLRGLIGALSEEGVQPISSRTRFDELGLDSVDRLELLVAIEARYRIALPDEHLVSPTVGHVVDALCTR
jgi:acyl carrier protein